MVERHVSGVGPLVGDPFVVGKAVWSWSLIEIVLGLYVLLAIRVPEFRPSRSRLVMFLSLHLAAVFIAGVPEPDRGSRPVSVPRR